MSEQIGKIDRPPSADYKKGRKLFSVPLIIAPSETEAGLSERIERYWGEVEAQVRKLEASLCEAHKVYHELIPFGGEKGVEAMEELSSGGYRVAKARLEKGAELQPVEDGELLLEFVDWSRCLAIGLQSRKVSSEVYESCVEAQGRRNDHIAKRVDETLGSDEVGLLLMREGQGVKFPPDIQVFYVAPPSLDEVRRWLWDHQANRESPESNDSQG